VGRLGLDPFDPRQMLERLVRGYAAAWVDRLSYGMLFLVLIPVVAVIAVVIFTALAIVLFGSYVLLGEPRLLGSVVGLTWFVGSLLILVLVLRRGHRWLTRLIAIADAPANLIDPYEDEDLESEPPDATTSAERLSALDARLAPPSRSSDDPRSD
jgi:hypothetical protein